MASLACLIAALPSSVRAAGPGELVASTHADVARVFADGSVDLIDARLADGQTLPESLPDPFLDALGTDVACGTVIARIAERLAPTLPAERLVEIRRLLDLPRLAAPRALPLADQVVIAEVDLSVGSRHAISRRDRDGDGRPDELDALDEALRAAASTLDAALAWTPEHAIALRVASTPFPLGTSRGDELVVPSWLDARQRGAAAAHQLAHRALRSVAPDLAVEAEEALAHLLAAEAAWPAEGLAPPPRTEAGITAPPPHQAVLSRTLDAASRDAAFLGFAADEAALDPTWPATLALDAQRQVELLRAQGQEIDDAARRFAFASALDEPLSEAGGGLAASTAAWHALLAEEQLRSLGEATPVDVLLPFDTRVAIDGPRLGPLAQLRFGLEVPERGGLRVRFDGPEELDASLLLLLADRSVRELPLAFDPYGQRAVSLPAGELRAALLLVRSTVAPATAEGWRDEAGAAESFSVDVQARPRHPFVVEALGARAGRDAVTLEWTSGAEEDVVAWHVERAARLGGPWRSVSPIPVPAHGDHETRASYALVDTTVEPATRYHYRIAALTRSGLRELGPSVSVLSLSAGLERAGRARRADPTAPADPTHPATPGDRRAR